MAVLEAVHPPSRPYGINLEILCLVCVGVTGHLPCSRCVRESSAGFVLELRWFNLVLGLATRCQNCVRSRNRFPVNSNRCNFISYDADKISRTRREAEYC